ncbi:MAG: galactokinase [bacterium]
MMLTRDEVSNRFEDLYKARPKVIARAPARANIIGEHTDYNGGFVLPFAIDRTTYAAAQRRDDQTVQVYSENMKEMDSFTLDSVEKTADRPWANYLRGLFWVLQQGDYWLKGVDLYIHGDVPLAAGLASSASMEVAALIAISYAIELSPVRTELVVMARRAETDFVGVPCGIMDQYTAVFAKAGQAILLDCQTLHYEHVPVDLGDAVFFIVDSGIRRKLEASDYSARQMECENAMQAMRPFYPGILSLRDVSMEQYERVRGKIPPNLEKRARHVIYENKRVNQMAAALKSKDAEGAGLLLTASHKSLSDLFEVSSSEIDLLVGMLIGIPGVLGARLMGAGFGGSILGLARNPDYGAIKRHLADKYTAVTGFATEVFPVHPSVGATLEKFL